MKKSGIAVAPDCESLPFPEDVRYLWNWFNELRVATCDDLSPVNIKAFFDLHKVELLPEEYAALQTLQYILHKAQSDYLK